MAWPGRAVLGVIVARQWLSCHRGFPCASAIPTAEAGEILQSFRRDGDCPGIYPAVLICGAHNPDLHPAFQIVNGSLSGHYDNGLVIHINGQRALLSFEQEAGVGCILDRTCKGARAGIALTRAESTLTALTGAECALSSSFGDNGYYSSEGAAFDTLTDDPDLSSGGQRRVIEERSDSDVCVLSHGGRYRREFCLDSDSVFYDAFDRADCHAAGIPAEGTALISAKLGPEPLYRLLSLFLTHLTALQPLPELLYPLLGHGRFFGVAHFICARLGLGHRRR